MQKDLLERYPDANVQVYAIWFDMVPGDARSEWPRRLLTDRRVEHWWDQTRAVGTWYAGLAPSMRQKLTPESKWDNGEVLWDAYLLYGADARWQDTPTHLILWGRTIVAARDSLRTELEAP